MPGAAGQERIVQDQGGSPPSRTRANTTTRRVVKSPGTASARRSTSVSTSPGDRGRIAGDRRLSERRASLNRDSGPSPARSPGSRLVSAPGTFSETAGKRRRSARAKAVAISLVALVAAAVGLATWKITSYRHQIGLQTVHIGKLKGQLEQELKLLGAFRDQNSDLQNELSSTSTNLAKVSSQLAGTSAISNMEKSTIGSLSSCLLGVEKSLNQITAQDNAGAVTTLQSVAPSCKVAQSEAGISSSGPGGPAYPFDFADPYAMRVGSQYFGFATNSTGSNIQVAESGDLSNWTPLGDALSSLPSWSLKGSTWAPSVLRLGGRYLLYYSTTSVLNHAHCISVAVSGVPQGPYVDGSQSPLVCQDSAAGSIDPYAYVGADGAPYLVWKNEGGSVADPSQPNAPPVQLPNQIVAQPLSGDGMSLVGRASVLLQPTEGWEGGVVEGPAMLVDNGVYLLFYSANNWNSPNYSIGLAVCSGPLGPCAKQGGGPIVASSASFVGPGGPGFFTDTSGQVWMCFHGWLPGQVGYPNSRYLFLRKVYVNGSTVSVAPQ